MLKKSQVLKEGYNQGLREAIRAIESQLNGTSTKRPHRKMLSESQILDNMCLFVNKHRFGEFYIRDTDSGLEFEASVWVNGDGTIDASISDDENANGERWRIGKQLAESPELKDMVINAVLDEYAGSIPGMQEYVDEYCEEYAADWDEAVNSLRGQLKREGDTYTKMNARIKRNMEMSPKELRHPDFW